MRYITFFIHASCDLYELGYHDVNQDGETVKGEERKEGKDKRG